MGLIPEDTITQVIERTDIVETISNYTPLKKAGRNFKGNCPFHNEKTPSFIVNPDKQIFHCFGCGVGGNVISFLMKHDHMTFPEAIRLLASRVGIEIAVDRKSGGDKSNLRQAIYHANNLAVSFYHEKLLSDQSTAGIGAREYLKSRGVSLETAKKLRLGFAPDEWESLIQHLHKQEISLGLIEKAGLSIKRDKGDGYYDRFRNRIIFPIFDTQGNARAFGARALDDSPAKYINSPETPVYTKGEHLYGFYINKQAISKQDFAIVVEGYMDALMVYQSGVENVLASLGTALTVEQIRLVRRYTKNIVLLFDSDQAGEAAMVRSLEALIEEGMNTRIASLKEGEDPDSFIRKFGVEAFNEQIKEAKSIFEFKLNVLSNRYGTESIESKAKISSEMLELIVKFTNEIMRNGYIQELASTLKVPEEALRVEFKKISQKGQLKDLPTQKEVVEPNVPTRIRAVEHSILKLLLEEEKYISDTREEIALTDFKDTNIRAVVSKIFELFDEGREVTNANVMSCFTDDAMQEMISKLSLREDDISCDKDKVFQDCISRIKEDRLKVQRKEILQQIQEAENLGDQEKLNQLKLQFNQLVRK